MEMEPKEGPGDDQEPLVSQGSKLSAEMIDVDLDQIDAESVQWDEDRFIWDLSELDYLNKKRAKQGLPRIEIVKKHEEVNLGIRAHPEMTVGKCLKSVFMPHQNEFIFIWLYLIFAITLWVYVGLLVSHDEGTYGFRKDENYGWMLVATLPVAISVTVSLIYLVFYSMSPRTERVLEKADWNFKVVAVFSLTLVFVYAEMSLYPVHVSNGLSLMDFFLSLTLGVSILVLVFSIFDSLRTAAWWLAFLFLLVLTCVDLAYASSQQIKYFYVPMLILLFLLLVTGIFIFF